MRETFNIFANSYNFIINSKNIVRNVISYLYISIQQSIGYMICMFKVICFWSVSCALNKIYTFFSTLFKFIDWGNRSTRRKPQDCRKSLTISNQSSSSHLNLRRVKIRIQRSIKHIHKTKDRVTRTPLKTEGELRCSGRVAVPASRVLVMI
jgi:hypothetical protein